MPSAISISGLTKLFPQKTGYRQLLLNRVFRVPHDTIKAVDGVTLDIQEQELFGLLGPNGAGKTTLIKMLCTLILPDAGTATINGFDLSEEEDVKASIGLVSGEERSFYWRLSGRQNLAFFAALHGLSARAADERIRRLTSLLELEDFIDRRFDRYSSGMKQRLGIARGLLNEPRILFLDEPTKSLDPTAAAHLRKIVYNLVHQEGYTAVLVTHHLHEAEELCDRVAIMQGGRIRVASDVAGLRRLVSPERRYRLDVRRLPAAAVDTLRGLAGVLAVETSPLDHDGFSLRVRLSGGGESDALARVVDVVSGAGGRIADVSSEDVSLEEIFMKYVEEQREQRR